MTREEAKITIDYLKSMQEAYIEGEGYERHPLPEWYALEKAIENIEQTMWIPVDKKTPDTDEEVLVDDGVDIFVAWWVNDGLEAGWHSFDESYDPHTPILAWMQRPTSYKESEK